MSNTIDIYQLPNIKVEAVVQLMVDGRLTSYRAAIRNKHQQNELEDFDEGYVSKIKILSSNGFFGL